MKHNLLIYNPVSGKNVSKDNYLGKIVQELTEEGDELTVYQTQGKGDARIYLRNMKVSYDTIICCGGDGTLHEVVNGVMGRFNRPVIGYIPCGSTNDYAKNIGISKDTAVQYIKKSDALQIDIGSMNGEYFNYIAAFGAFTNIPFITSQKVKNIFGYFAYLLEGIKHLSDIKPQYIHFQIEDKLVEDSIVMGMITNAFVVAGIITTNSKETKLDDGLMEYLFIKMPRNILELQTIIASLLSEKIDGNLMYFGQAEKIYIRSEELMEWTLDGEDGGMHDKVEIKTHPGRMYILKGDI